jgi:hypothetical protein
LKLPSAGVLADELDSPNQGLFTAEIPGDASNFRPLVELTNRYSAAVWDGSSGHLYLKGTLIRSTGVEFDFIDAQNSSTD